MGTARDVRTRQPGRWRGARSVLLGVLALSFLALPAGCQGGGEDGDSAFHALSAGEQFGDFRSVDSRRPLTDWRQSLWQLFGAVRGHGVQHYVTFADDRRVRATVTDGRAEVEVVLFNGSADTFEGVLHAAIRHLDGTLVDQQSAAFAIGHGFLPLRLTLTGLPADATLTDLAAYAIDYEVQSPRFARGVFGRRSLFEAVNKLEIQVLTADRYPADESAFLRLIARNPATGAPAAGAPVAVSLELPDGTLTPVGQGVTDELGALAAELALPPGYEGTAKLVVEVEDDSGVDRAEADVTVLPDVRILLTTDKPLYQPGQTMHLRALVLNRASKEPYAGGEVIFEVADAAGNKVFKERQVADEYGIAATTFQLATQVNRGAFRLKAMTGEAAIEKEVTVDRYALPKYKVEATLDKPYYLPGETVHGTVSAQYFFGQPVAGGQVTVTAATYDIGFTEFAAVSGVTNAEGLFPFEFGLPAYVVGQPLEQGNGLVKVDVTVVDSADQEQSISRTTVVSRADVEVTLVPESGELVPGVENAVYVVVSDPMGGPLSGTATVVAEGGTYPVALDAQGLGAWVFTPQAVPVEATVTVETPTAADPVTLTETLQGGGVGQTILLRTDAALYQVGDTIEATVLLPTPRARVFLDLVQSGRTVATEAIDVEDGVGRWAFDVDGSLEGALQLDAYFLGENSEIVRDQRLVYVDPADALDVRLTPDREVYLPGDPATVGVEVTDAAGAPKAAALGLQVVDEAVFALQEVQPGLLKVYFELEELLSQAKFQFAWPDLDPASVIEPPEDDGPGGSDGTVDADRQRRAEVAFAAQAGGAAAYGIDVNTHKLRLKDVATLLKPFVEADRDRVVTEAGALAYAGEGLTWDDVPAYVAGLRVNDPWQRPYRFVETAVESGTDGWWWFPGDNHVWAMTSDGPDELSGTADDLSAELDTFWLWYGYDQNGGGWGPDVDFDGEWPGAGGCCDDGVNEPPADPSSGGEENAAPRVRRWFPETLFVDPAVLTDGSGHAEVAFTIADSITSWRMTALANSADGLLGSATAGLTVFQDFFVDIVFPATLTRGDVVSVPVAVYNYLDIPQTVTLTAQDADWLTFLNGAEVTIPLDPGQVDSIYFDVAVDTVGTHALTVVAMGTAMSDAIERQVLVESDGKEIIDTASARFHTTGPADQVVTEEVAKVVPIPEAAIDGSPVLLVKVYPGFFSQAVEGLDSMLRLPGG